MREVDIVGVRVEMPSNQPIVLLREPGTDRYLPIWIGAAEASAIAFAQQGLQPPRPLTHDLMADLLNELGHTLTQVRITTLNDGVFEAVLVLDASSSTSGIEVSARPSDAIALALRTGTRVWCADDVLEEAAITSPAGEDDDPEAQAEEEVERFREFLDQVAPEDFEQH